MKLLSGVRNILLCATVVFGSGCASMSEHRDSNLEPNVRLDQLLALYQEARHDGSSCHEMHRAYSAVNDCERIQREVERLALEFPANERIAMTNAVMQFESGRFDKAQFTLDQLLTRPGPHPEAAILRSKIAMQDGNASRARVILEQEILLSPDYAELREALAATYYVEGKYKESRAALAAAGRLGASGWKMAYHEGLLREAKKDWAGACRFYLIAVDQKPDFREAVSRLVGLGEHDECRDVTERR